jgi:hypothetical protein
METTHEPLHLRQLQFGTVKYQTYLHLDHSVLFDKEFKYGDDAKF